MFCCETKNTVFHLSLQHLARSCHPKHMQNLPHVDIYLLYRKDPQSQCKIKQHHQPNWKKKIKKLSGTYITIVVPASIPVHTRNTGSTGSLGVILYVLLQVLKQNTPEIALGQIWRHDATCIRQLISCSLYVREKQIQPSNLQQSDA